MHGHSLTIAPTENLDLRAPLPSHQEDESPCRSSLSSPGMCHDQVPGLLYWKDGTLAQLSAFRFEHVRVGGLRAPPAPTLTHSLNLRLWILGQRAPSGAGEQVAASLRISAPSGSSDWLSPTGEGHMDASVPPGASQNSKSQHSTCGAGAGQCHQGSQRHPTPAACKQGC